MDQSQAQNISQAAQQVTQGTMQSAQVVSEQGLSMMQGNMQFAQDASRASCSSSRARRSPCSR